MRATYLLALSEAWSVQPKWMQAIMAMGKSRKSRVPRFSIGFTSMLVYVKEMTGLSRLRSYLLADTQNGMEQGLKHRQDVRRAADAFATAAVSDELLVLIMELL
jgi:hypothetical protein